MTNLKEWKKILTFFALAIMMIPSVIFGANYTDEIGRSVTIEENPGRIVSLAPDITETLFALGLENEVVGVTLFSNYPEAAAKKPKVGSFVNLSIENIVALSPDLVIATANGNRKKTILKLEEMGIPVYVTYPKDFDDIFRMIVNIGRITGREDVAKNLVESLLQKVDKISSMTGTKKPKVLFQIGIDPIVSVGRDTIHNRLITLAGGINILEDVEIEYPRVSMEKVIIKRPEIIVISSMRRGGEFIRERDRWNLWKDIPAVRSGRVHIIDSDLTDHFSPRIVEGLEELVRVFHPEMIDVLK
ncbi:MAG: cobalamin-binding protein [Deltaproteobacteria bacterium]|nr:cobalamin-binding protein [Deltaproteobacteria bacterium]